jgi:deoxyribodipyrimidine photo-lyase
MHFDDSGGTVRVPETRIRALNDAEPADDGEWVLYWMVAARRTRCNPSLEHAVERANALGLPLVIFEPLRIGYRWASDRHHRFILDGMRDTHARCAEADVRYIPWVEPRAGDGKGLLARLAERAALVITDDWPCFFVPRMQQAAADALSVPLVAVDSNGLLPLSATDRTYTTAASFRRHIQKTILPHLQYRPADDPLTGVDHPMDGTAPLPDGWLADWPSAFDPATHTDDDAIDTVLAALDIDHAVRPTGLRGGSVAGEAMLERFLEERLANYPERNHPDVDGASRLSPYLHYGHVGAADVFWRVLDDADWTPDDTGPVNGSRGWWGLPEAHEAFADEIVTWRELGHVFAHHAPDTYDSIDSIPDWAKKTLDAHADDPRELVPFEDLERAASPDPIWNAAQRQLLEAGVIHNYLRMLWGKKVLQWAEDPQTAFEWLTELNNKYALDGRDPNSASGIAWVFGRHDRAWGPERPIFGKVRYMTSDSTKRKLKLSDWLDQWGA